MDISNSPYFAMLRTRLGYLNARQKVLAENVANASTPGFVPRDMDTRAFEDALGRAMPGSGGMRGSVSGPHMAPMSMATTRAGHMSTSAPASSQIRTVSKPDSETTLDGNAVVLEEQMIAVADTRVNYDMALSLYQKGLGLMRLAARRPGG